MKKFITILFLLFVFVNVEAMELKPTGVNKAGKGSDIEIYITLTRQSSEKEVSAVDGTITYDSKVLTLKSQSNLLASNNWTELSNVSNGGKFAYANLTFNNLIKETSKNIVKLVFTVNANASGTTEIKLTNQSATDAAGDGVSINGGSHTISILSNVNTLSDIKINSTTISNFSPNTTTYSKEVTDSSITITATATDSKSSITGVGTKNLNYGNNTFKIVVTSEAGNTREYILNITRKDTRSGVNTLKNLSLSSGTINFNANTNNYNIQVDKEVSKIKITSTLTDTKSKYVNGFGNREVELKEGLNKVLIKVMAENGSTRVYTLNITRGEVKTEVDNKGNNKIKELLINDYEIDFTPDVLEYNLTIKDESELDIKVTLENEKATYEILDNENLEDGSVITIKVKAEDESVLEYKINISKEQTDDNNNPDDNVDDNQDDNTDNDTTINTTLYIAIGIFGLGLILFIIAIICKKKKNS